MWGGTFSEHNRLAAGRCKHVQFFKEETDAL
jgi:hypothetical protein